MNFIEYAPEPSVIADTNSVFLCLIARAHYRFDRLLTIAVYTSAYFWNGQNYMIDRVKFLAAALAALAFLPFGATAQSGQSAKTPEARLAQVMGMAEEGRFETALFIMDYFPEEEKSSYEYAFTRARILSWYGDYGAADALYRKLRAAHPEDQDILVGSGFLEFYQGNLEQSEFYFQQVVDMNPLYTDAYNALRRVQKMRADQPQIPVAKTVQAAESCPAGYTLASDGRCLRYTRR